MKIKANSYHGFYRNTIIKHYISKQDIINGYKKVICFECNGSKIFTYPDDTIDSCINCKGTGYVYINC